MSIYFMTLENMLSIDRQKPGQLLDSHQGTDMPLEQLLKWPNVSLQGIGCMVQLEGLCLPQGSHCPAADLAWLLIKASLTQDVGGAIGEPSEGLKGILFTDGLQVASCNNTLCSRYNELEVCPKMCLQAYPGFEEIHVQNNGRGP